MFLVFFSKFCFPIFSNYFLGTANMRMRSFAIILRDRKLKIHSSGKPWWTSGRWMTSPRLTGSSMNLINLSLRFDLIINPSVDRTGKNDKMLQFAFFFNCRPAAKTRICRIWTSRLDLCQPTGRSKSLADMTSFPEIFIIRDSKSSRLKRKLTSFGWTTITRLSSNLDLWIWRFCLTCVKKKLFKISISLEISWVTFCATLWHQKMDVYLRFMYAVWIHDPLLLSFQGAERQLTFETDQPVSLRKRFDHQRPSLRCLPSNGRHRRRQRELRWKSTTSNFAQMASDNVQPQDGAATVCQLLPTKRKAVSYRKNMLLVFRIASHWIKNNTESKLKVGSKSPIFLIDYKTFQGSRQPLDRQAVEPGPRVGHPRLSWTGPHPQAAILWTKDCSKVSSGSYRRVIGIFLPASIVKPKNCRVCFCTIPK